jgi:hypothetical protein
MYPICLLHGFHLASHLLLAPKWKQTLLRPGGQSEVLSSCRKTPHDERQAALSHSHFAIEGSRVFMFGQSTLHEATRRRDRQFQLELSTRIVEGQKKRPDRKLQCAMFKVQLDAAHRAQRVE